MSTIVLCFVHIFTGFPYTKSLQSLPIIPLAADTDTVDDCPWSVPASLSSNIGPVTASNDWMCLFDKLHRTSLDVNRTTDPCFILVRLCATMTTTTVSVNGLMIFNYPIIYNIYFLPFKKV